MGRSRSVAAEGAILWRGSRYLPSYGDFGNPLRMVSRDAIHLDRGNTGTAGEFRPALNGIRHAIQPVEGLANVKGIGKRDEVRGRDVPGFSADQHLMLPRPFSRCRIMRKTCVVGRSDAPIPHWV